MPSEIKEKADEQRDSDGMPLKPFIIGSVIGCAVGTAFGAALTHYSGRALRWTGSTVSKKTGWGTRDKPRFELLQQ